MRASAMTKLIIILLAASAVFVLVPCAAWAAVHDFDISYYRYLNTDNVKDRDALTMEEIIYHWADAFYEATNGESTLGTIRIYQGPTKYVSDYIQSDIVWEAAGHPMAASGGGMSGSSLKPLGMRINMYDTFTDNAGGNKTAEFMKGGKEAAYAGYILASLTSSYLYNLRAEYAHSRGKAKFEGLGAPSIMNDPAPAAYEGDLRSLNYSAAGSSSGEAATAQKKKWDNDAWSYLTKEGMLKKAPTAKGKEAPYKIDNEAGKHNRKALKNLKIIWVHSPVYVLAIDQSGSMNGERMERAKFAAKEYINSLPVGHRIGIITFNENVYYPAEITTLTAQNIKEQKRELISVIDSLQAGGNTAIYDACDAAWAAMELLNDSIYEGRHIILITDGEDNSSSTTPEEVISSCRRMKVSVNIIGLEEGVNEQRLRKIADSTKGYYMMTAEPLDTQEMLYSYMNNRAEAQINKTDGAMRPGEATRMGFIVDKDADTLQINVMQAQYSGSDKLSVTAQPANGKPIYLDYSPDSGKYEATVKNPAAGSWQVTVKNIGKRNVTVRGTAYLSRKGSALFLPSIRAVPGEAYGSLIAYATFTGNGIPYTGLTCKATLERPNGGKENIEFNDIGIQNDELGGDGVYTAIINNCTGAGNFRLTVSFANNGGALSSTGHFFFAPPAGGGDYAISDNAIRLLTKMERVATYTFQQNVGGRKVETKTVNWERLNDKLEMARRSYENNNYNVALDYLKEAERLKKDHAPIYLMKGKIMDARNNYSGAIYEYGKACEHGPEDPENFYMLGQCYTYIAAADSANRGKWTEKAKEVYAHMSSKWPNDKWTQKMAMALRYIKSY